MIIAFQVILIIIMLIGLLGTIGERKDKDLSNRMTTLCVAAMACFIAVRLWL